ncbi:hypothetical protein N665_2951s0003, partial [Sinapis alba]
DPRDAEDAIHGRDGYDFDGHSLRLELAHGGRRSSNDARPSSRGGGGDRGHGPSRRSDYRVLVSGLPSSASWKDLKDHMRKGGEIYFSQVYRDGRGTTGIVDYTSYEDLKYAIKKFNDTEFRNAFSQYDSRRDSRSPSNGRSYSKSCSRSRSRSRRRRHSRSRSRGRSESRSPKAKSSRRSPAKSTSRSPPRSRSNSRSPPPRGYGYTYDQLKNEN